jgi:type II secretory pathway pseudopilin PulG
MKRDLKWEIGFTLLDLLVVITISGLLAAFLLPALGAAKGHVRRTFCLDNLKQINLGLRMYSDDYNGLLPITSNGPPKVWSGYEIFMRNYVGLKGSPSINDKLFACPADRFHYLYKDYVSDSLHLQLKFGFSSYAFNAGNSFTAAGQPTWPGIAGWKLSSISEPAKTVFVAEFPAFYPYSWHDPVAAGHVNNARDVVSFADGHVNYIRLYWDATNLAPGHLEACNYDPPAAYDYKWRGN